MKYSVGYQQNSQWIEAIVKNRAAVYECYFSFGAMPSGRHGIAEPLRQMEDLGFLAEESFSRADFEHAFRSEAAPDEETRWRDVADRFDDIAVFIQEYGVNRELHEKGVDCVALFDEHCAIFARRRRPAAD